MRRPQLTKSSEKLEKMSAWQVTKVKSKKEVIKKAQKREKDSSFFDTGGLEPPQELGIGATVPKIVKVVRCDVVKHNSGSHAAFTGAGLVSISNDGCKKCWMLLPDNLDALDK